MEKVFFFVMLILGSHTLWAFPEMIRHGYTQCTACHESKLGGDFLTEYGKSLAQEILSAHKTEYFQTKTPAWLQLGGDVRLLQTMVENKTSSRGRFLIMQAEVAALFKFDSDIKAGVSLARYEPKSADAIWRDFIYAPQYWISKNWMSDDEESSLSLRAGKFLPGYGVLLSEHVYVNRINTELTPGQERGAVELIANDAKTQVNLTKIFNRFSYNKIIAEDGWLAQVSHLFKDQVRLGFNIYRSDVEQASVVSKKSFEGIFGLIGWNKEWSTLFQIDRLYLDQGKTGISEFLKVGFEVTQGVNLFMTQEYSNYDVEKSDPKVENYGVGVDYFPMTNVHLTAAFRNEKNTALTKDASQVIWLIFHGYM